MKEKITGYTTKEEALGLELLSNWVLFVTLEKTKEMLKESEEKTLPEVSTEFILELVNLLRSEFDKNIFDALGLASKKGAEFFS